MQRRVTFVSHKYMFIKLLLLFGMLVWMQDGISQCSTIGQSPSSAFPVCGTKVFEQDTVPICSSGSLYVPGCSVNGNADYADKNPFWYKFTCYETGTLGFLIQPNDKADDYDWQLYDITGLDPKEVFTNKNIIVTGNWAGNPGNTGTSSAGVSYIQCASAYDGNESRFAQMPQIFKGHKYLLLVSHFSNNQSGYKLSFGGGTAVITDDLMPDIVSATAFCDAKSLTVSFNKKLKCSSLAADGSDFTLSIPGVDVIKAVGVNCDESFELDRVVLTLDKPLPPGHYQVFVNMGTDSSTVLDACDRGVSVGRSVGFEVLPRHSTPMGQLKPLSCAPETLKLEFAERIRCSSIAPDGSDFVVTGPSSISVISAVGNCEDDGTFLITIQLSQPITVGGNYVLTLKKGKDGDPLINECGMATPVGSTAAFSLKDTVNADFTYTLGLGCRIDTIQFFHPGGNGVNSWNWQMDYAGHSHLQNPVAYFTEFRMKQISLMVSNGFCTDSSVQQILLDNELVADFEMSNTICPEDSAVFQDKSRGRIVSWIWNFGNGLSDNTSHPLPQKYPITGIERYYPVRLIVQDANCADTSVRQLKVLSSCYIDVPNAFTPNLDGLNDYLYPLNAFKAIQLQFRVYNRGGLLLFSSENSTAKWDGTYRGEPQDAGIYVWTLFYVISDTGKQVYKKGATVLIR